MIDGINSSFWTHPGAMSGTSRLIGGSDAFCPGEIVKNMVPDLFMRVEVCDKL